MSFSGLTQKNLGPGEIVIVPASQDGNSLSITIYNAGAKLGQGKMTFGGDAIFLPIPTSCVFCRVLDNQAAKVVISNVGETTLIAYWIENQI